MNDQAATENIAPSHIPINDYRDALVEPEPPTLAGLIVTILLLAAVVAGTLMILSADVFRTAGGF